LTAVNVGVHFPNMENLINAFAEKEALFRDVRKIIAGFEK
jgi:hypothetical protein